MFSPKDIRLYKSIQAPEHLKERIMQASTDEKPKNSHIYSVGTALIAACLVLAMVSLFPFGTPAVSYEGTVIGTKPVAVSSGGLIRTAAVAPAAIELEVSKAADITVSHGETERTEADTLLWVLPPDVTEATLTVTRNKKSTLYFLRVDANGIPYMEKQ